jgi:tetratricopeptide (TPR) repeat protein
MISHSFATSVVTTAVVSTAASTMVNRMLTRDWRHTRALFARWLAHGDPASRAVADFELAAYAEVAASVADRDGAVPCRALRSVLQLRLTGLITEHPCAVAELQALLTDLNVPVELPTPLPANNTQPAVAAVPAPRAGGTSPAPVDVAGCRGVAAADDSSEPFTRSGGGVPWRLGEVDEAVEHYQLALALARQVDDRSGQAHALNRLGAAYDQLGRHEDARTCCLRALDIQRGLGERAAEGVTLANLGKVHEHLWRHEDAHDFYRQALAVHRETADRFSEIATLVDIGAVYRVQRRYLDALEVQRSALRLCRQQGDRHTQVGLLNSQGETHFGLGEYELALAGHAHALIAAIQLAVVSERARAHNGIARLLADKCDFLAARTHWRHALELFRMLRSPQAEQVEERLRECGG